MRLSSSAPAFALLACVSALGFSSHAEAIGEKDSDLGFNLTGDPALAQFSIDYKVLLIPEKTYQAAGGTADGLTSDKTNGLLYQKVSQELLAPGVTTQEGLKTTVEVMRDFPYALRFHRDKVGKLIGSDIRTRKIGIHITCLPTFTADKRTAELALECEITNLQGWLTTSAEVKEPIFSTRRIKTQCLASFDKPTFVWFLNPAPNGATALTDPDASRVREGLMITIRRTDLAAR